MEDLELILDDGMVRAYKAPVGLDKERLPGAYLHVAKGEKMYESRLYQYDETNPAAIGHIARTLISNLPDESLAAIARATVVALEKWFYLFLAKQRTTDGRILFILIWELNRGNRKILHKSEWISEEDFREAVVLFENSWDFLKPAQVIDKAGWDDYLDLMEKRADL